MKAGRPKVERPTKTKVVRMRVTQETFDELNRIAGETGRTVSSILEAAFRRQHPPSF